MYGICMGYVLAINNLIAQDHIWLEFVQKWALFNIWNLKWDITKVYCGHTLFTGQHPVNGKIPYRWIFELWLFHKNMQKLNFSRNWRYMFTRWRTILHEDVLWESISFTTIIGSSDVVPFPLNLWDMSLW